MQMGGVMKRIVKFVTTNWGDKMAIRWITNIVFGVHIGLGTAVLAGGANAFFPPAYKPLLDMVNGHLWIWGFWVLGSAGLMIIPARWPQIIGLWFAMFWQIMWGVSFAIATVNYSGAGAIEAVAFGGFALINAALITARLVERDGG